MTSVEPCTTFSQNRKHLSATLQPAQHGNPGRQGRTLCNEDADDETHASWRNARDRRPALVLVSLPECKRCATAAKKLENAR